MSTEPAPTDVTDLIPKPVRTTLYAIGTFDAVGIVPALLAAGWTVAAGIASGLAGGCLAVAFGYRPTRPTP